MDRVGTRVRLLEDQKIVIALENNEKTQFFLTDENLVFYIDNFGIHSPVQSLLFNGAFGNNRIATMLPSNYKI